MSDITSLTIDIESMKIDDEVFMAPPSTEILLDSIRESMKGLNNLPVIVSTDPVPVETAVLVPHPTTTKEVYPRHVMLRVKAADHFASQEGILFNAPVSKVFVFLNLPTSWRVREEKAFIASIVCEAGMGRVLVGLETASFNKMDDKVEFVARHLRALRNLPMLENAKIIFDTQNGGGMGKAHLESRLKKNFDNIVFDGMLPLDKNSTGEVKQYLGFYLDNGIFQIHQNFVGQPSVLELLCKEIKDEAYPLGSEKLENNLYDALVFCLQYALSYVERPATNQDVI